MKHKELLKKHILLGNMHDVDTVLTTAMLGVWPEGMAEQYLNLIEEHEDLEADQLVQPTCWNYGYLVGLDDYDFDNYNDSVPFHQRYNRLEYRYWHKDSYKKVLLKIIEMDDQEAFKFLNLGLPSNTLEHLINGYENNEWSRDKYTMEDIEILAKYLKYTQPWHKSYQKTKYDHAILLKDLEDRDILNKILKANEIGIDPTHTERLVDVLDFVEQELEDQEEEQDVRDILDKVLKKMRS